LTSSLLFLKNWATPLRLSTGMVWYSRV